MQLQMSSAEMATICLDLNVFTQSYELITTIDVT